MSEAKNQETQRGQNTLHFNTNQLICQRACQNEQQQIEHQNSIDELINLLGWKWKYFDLPSLSQPELEDFNSRTFQAKQEQDENGRWFLKKPWSLTKASFHDSHKYYYSDFYETIVGKLNDKEFIGTDGAFNCITIAITGNGQFGEKVFGISHQNFLWNKQNTNVNQIIDSLNSNFKNLTFILNFEDEELERIKMLGKQVSSSNIKLIGIPRGIKNDSVGELVVSNDKIIFQYGKRMSNHKEQFVLSWEEINEIDLKHDEPFVILPPKNIKF